MRAPLPLHRKCLLHWLAHRRAPEARLAGMLLGLLAALAPTGARAQAGTVAGVVVDARTERPLADVRVAVEGTGHYAVTDLRGRFRLENLPGPQVVLLFSRIGYRATTQQVEVGGPQVRVVLSETPVELNAVVVTGTPGEVQKRSLGNAVASVSAPELVEAAPVTDVSQLLNARAPGVVLQQQQGTAGGGARILIRGRSSLQFDGDPLIYVDGVRVNNDLATGIFTGEAGSTIELSRLDDFDPGDIENIEVIRGPAAATLYGTEASAGVIQIITKKGRPGRPRVGVQIRQGANWVPNEAEVVGFKWGADLQTGEPRQFSPLDVLAARGSEFFRTGWTQGYGVDVSGGLEDVQYYVSGNWDRDEGVVPSNVAEKFRARANLTFRPHSSLDINASLGVTTGRTDTYGFQYFFNTRYWFPLLFQLDAPNQGFLSVPPDVQLKTQDVFQDLDRFTGGVQVNHRPTTWFSHRLALGLDLTNQEDVYLIPFVPDEFAAVYSPTARLGSKSVDGTEAEFNTVDYSGTFTLPLAGGLRSNTSIGGQLYRSFLKVEELAGQEFPAPGVTAIAAITGPTQVSEDQVENTTVGLYVQQQFSWNERLFLTGAVRMDDNSAFGADFDVVAYPKVSASWVVSEEPFWRVPWLHDLRLRAAYGESGQQPNAFAAIRTYQPIAGRDDRPSGSPQFVGNPDLGPERGREIEAGFDAGLLGDRIGVEFTYYYKRTDDAIVSRAVAPSTGFPATQFVNAGEVTNKGFELLLRGRPFDTRVLDWELTLNLSHNDNEVTSLALAGVPFIGVGFIPNRHQPGFPVASYFGKKIVSAELDADGNAVNILCDGGSPRGKLALDGTPLEAGGPAVDCLGAPDLYLGPNVPHTEGSVASTITLFDRLRFYALLDFKLGRKYFSSDKALLCSVFRTHEINFFPERFDPIDVATCQVSVTGFFDDGFILDADFAKLRELSLNYALPDRWAARLGASRASITVAARNVYTWRPGGPFDTTDPEVFTPVNYASSNHNQGIVPLPVQFLTTVNLTF